MKRTQRRHALPLRRRRPRRETILSTNAAADRRIPAGLWTRFRCPACGSPLAREGEGARCTACLTAYERRGDGPLDLRLRAPKSETAEFTVGAPPAGEDDIACVPLPMNPRPDLDPRSIRIPHHFTREMVSWIPRARSAEALALDLGCGEAIHRSLCEAAGYGYVGLDYGSPKAPLLGDAHALPFQDESFELIISIAVLEHVTWPFLMMREAHRVLRPGGMLLGTVAFLEPFHENSHYHHTHLGTLNSLRYGGFDVERIAPSEEWNVLTAQASMGFFPKLPRAVGRALVLPLEILQRSLWKAGTLLRPDPARRSRTRNTTGAFVFIARRPG